MDTDSQRRARPWRRPARFGFWILAAIVMGVALIPGRASVPTLLGWDKIDHITAFFVLTVLARLGWPLLSKTWLLFMLLSYGVLVEILQTLPFVGRSADIIDIVADGIGIGIGFLIAPVISWGLRRFVR